MNKFLSLFSVLLLSCSLVSCSQQLKVKWIEGKKYNEIAAMLNISEKTVEFHMSKALKSLRKAISDYFTR